MSQSLMPCPFCGGSAERIDFGPGSGENEGGSCIACTRCQASGPVEFGYKENFVSNWNRRTHPQPVTPAGGEVVLTGWTKADGKTLWMEHDGLPVFNEGKHDDLGTNKAIHLYTHPPVADAAPPKVGLSADELLHITSGLPAKWRRWADGLRGIQAANRIRDCADDLDSALNQRGGG